MRSPGSETGTERGGRRVAIHAQFATFPDISSGVVSLFFPGLEVGALKRASHGVYLGNSNNTSNIQFVFVMKLLPSNPTKRIFGAAGSWCVHRQQLCIWT